MTGSSRQPTGRRAARQLGALAAVLATGMAVLATQPAPPSAEASVETAVSLGPEKPVAVFRASIEIERGDAPFSHAALTAFDDVVMDAAESWLTIVPADAAEPIRQPAREGSFGPSFYGEAVQDILPVCADGCSRTYLVVVRLVDPARTGTVEFTTSLDIYESTQGAGADDGPAAAQVAVTVDHAPELGGSAFVRASAAGQLTVDAERSSALWSGRLIVPADALPADAGLVHGGIWLDGRVGGTDEDATAHLVLTVDGIAEPHVFADWHQRFDTVSTEWRSRCVAEQPCEIPVRLELRWPCNLLACPRRSATKTVDFKLEARLEYLDRPTVPPAARLELEADD